MMNSRTENLARIFAVKQTPGPHMIASGLRMYLLKQRGRYAKIVPTISIERTVDGISRPIKVSVSRKTLAQRYKRMVGAYCEHFELDILIREILLERQPPFEVFTNYLLPRDMAKGVISPAEAEVFVETHKGGSSSLLPSLSIFQAAEDVASNIPAHISLQARFLTLFKQSNESRRIILFSVPYHDGDVLGAVNAAARQLNEILRSEKTRRREQHPADFVRYYVDSGKSRGSYVVNHPKARTRTFSFKLTESSADRSLHAYRSALQYAAHLIFQPVELDIENWRTLRLYQVGHPMVKGHVWYSRDD